MSFDLPTAGLLRDLIHFERNHGVPVGGEIQDNWQTYAPSRAAAIQPTRGGEQVIADRLSGSAGYDIWLRYDVLARGLKAGDRAVNDRTGEVYTVGAPIDPNQRRQWLLIQGASNGAPPNPAGD